MPLWHCGLPFAGVPHSLLSRSAQHTAPFNKLLYSEETVRLWSQKSSLRVKGKRNPSLPSSQTGEDLGPSSNKRQSRFPISSFLIPTPHRWRGHCYDAPKDKGRNCVCDQLRYVHRSGAEWGFSSNANVTGQSRFAVTTVQSQIQFHKPREASVPRLPS